MVCSERNLLKARKREMQQKLAFIERPEVKSWKAQYCIGRLFVFHCVFSPENQGRERDFFLRENSDAGEHALPPTAAATIIYLRVQDIGERDAERQ
jgi:hypothetical protein